PHPAPSAHIQETLAIDLFLVHNRHKEIARESYKSPAEFRRRHAENRKRVFIELNGATDDATIVFEAVVPIRIRKDDVGSAVGPMFVRGVEETAEIGLDVHY